MNTVWLRARAFLSACVMCWPVLAQQSAAQRAQQPADQQQAPVPGQPEVQEGQQGPLLIPAGTTVPVTLTGAIFTTRSVHKGDAVRVVTAFPAAVGTALAI